MLGAAWQVTQAQLWSLWAFQGLLVLGLLMLLLAGPLRRRPLLCWLLLMWAAACCVAGATGWRAHAYLAQTLPKPLEAVDLQVEGAIASMVQSTGNGQRWRFVVDAAPPGVPPLLELAWYGPYGKELDASQPLVPPWAQGVALSPGQRWRLTVRIKRPHGARNPHGFDYELQAWEQGVQATGYVREQAQQQLLAVTAQYPLQRWRQWLRDRIQAQSQRLQTWLPGVAPDRQQAALGVAAALAVGDQQAIDRKDWAMFRQTGVSLLMSISGLHITMFAWLAALLVGWVWRRSGWLCLRVPAPSAALVGGLVLATAYALFSGWGVPSQRTVLMLATVTLLRLSGRRWPWPFVWLLACALVVAVDPWALLQAGFWLSFVAVGVLFATDAGHHANTHAVGARLALRARLRAMVREQWVVTVALAPLALLFFGQVSVVGLLANMVAIPWVTLLVTPLAMLGVLVTPAWDVAAWALAALMVLLQWLAQWSFATFSVATPALWMGAMGILGGILLVARLPWWVRLLGLPLVLPVLLWQAPRPAAGEFELLAADIGQGSAVLVRTAGHTLVYDAGPRYSLESDAGHRVLVPLLRALGERVDILMLSHSDLDHTGGAAAVLAMQTQAALVSSLEDGHPLLASRVSTRCTAGQRWQWDGVVFEVLHPQAIDYDMQKKPNAKSCVLRISAPNRSVLLAGDIEAAQELRLVGADAAALRADVLLVPHHGSKTSSSAPFLDAVTPRFALVQAGYRNRFGHPAPVVMDRYTSRGIAVRDSVHCGAATWSSAEPTKVLCEREHAPRYWQHVPP